MQSRLKFDSIRSVLIALLAFLLVPAFGSGPARANQGGGDAPVIADYYKKPASSPKKTTGTSPKKAGTKKVTPARGPGSIVRRVVRIPRESAPSGMPPEGESRFANEQVIVRYRLSARQGSMDALVRRLNLLHLGGRTFTLAGVTVHLYQIVDGTPVREVIAALEADPTVVAAQPNYLYELSQTAGASALGSQYALQKLEVAPAHELATGSGVPVAVIDSMIDTSHPEFQDATIALIDADGGADGDAHPHGTSIAGVIAAHGTLVGVAPGVRLIGIRAFLPDEAGGEGAHGTSWRILTALEEAARAGARVVNMSFAGPEDPLVGASVSGAIKRGMIAVAAAGNGGPDAKPLYPAAYPGVVAVTAIDKDDAIYARANRGAYVTFAAPGVDILVPAPNGTYQVSSGTSIAAAHISGLAALLLSRDQALAASRVAEILAASAVDLGDAGRDAVFGAGLPHALAAIKATSQD